ncbi:prephenate dehydratase [Candidatus Margulisiibacteriota bacterium]
MRVAYLGPEGTFSEEAAKCFASKTKCELISYETIYDAIRAVEDRDVEKAVVPLENSVEGTVATTLDQLVNSKLLIEKEIDLKIVQNLLLTDIKGMNAITNIYSHAQAIAQCQGYLRKNYPNVNIHPVDSTAKACAIVQGKADNHTAAIANKNAAKLYKLAVFANKINDYKDNITRFVVIGYEESPVSGQDKTSIVFSLAKDRPGGLYSVLGEFAERKINLTKIESRPAKKEMGDYLFFIDLEGHQNSKKVKNALNAVEQRASFFKLLGSYPKTC